MIPPPTITTLARSGKTIFDIVPALYLRVCQKVNKEDFGIYGNAVILDR
jgi:hypothetical protein